MKVERNMLHFTGRERSLKNSQKGQNETGSSTTTIKLSTKPHPQLPCSTITTIAAMHHYKVCTLTVRDLTSANQITLKRSMFRDPLGPACKPHMYRIRRVLPQPVSPMTITGMLHL